MRFLFYRYFGQRLFSAMTYHVEFAHILRVIGRWFACYTA